MAVRYGVLKLVDPFDIYDLVDGRAGRCRGKHRHRPKLRRFVVNKRLLPTSEASRRRQRDRPRHEEVGGLGKELFTSNNT
jgi:hypothetical protein